jgi:hypothetical protein
MMEKSSNVLAGCGAMRKYLESFVLCVALLLSAGARAQGSEPWQFQAVLYGYLPSVDGESRFPPQSGGPSVSIDANAILKLKMTFMGSLEARKGEWGAYTDVLYVDLGNSGTLSRSFSLGGSALPAGASANADYDLKGVLWTLGGAYRGISTPQYKLDLIAGVRLLDVQQTLRWQVTGNIGTIPLQDRAGAPESHLTNWDAVVGFKGRAAFGEDQHWFAPYYFDVGAGESSFTGQAMVGFGYSFKWGDVFAAWRYIYYEMKANENIDWISFNGPGIAVAFRW